MSDILAIVIAVLSGAGAACMATLIGYAKAWASGKERFDAERASYTVVLGMILGGIAGGLNISVIEAQHLLESVGLFAAVVYFSEAGLKAIVRYLRRRFGDLE